MENLFEYGPNGSLQGINKVIFGEGKELIKTRKDFENSSLKSSTQFVEQVNRDELIQSISKVHSSEVEDRFKEKLDMIENSPICEGDFISIVDSVNRDYFKSKSTIILHISRTANPPDKGKIYDCFIHSVCFELAVSTTQAILYLVPSVVAAGMFLMSGRPQYSLAVAGGVAFYSAVQMRPKMPDFVEEALNLLMVDKLRAQGFLIEGEQGIFLNNRK